jgi:hypothetical protein
MLWWGQMTSKSELVKCAKVVRAKCLSYAFSPSACNFYYYKEKSLKYMCAVASATLVEYLKRRRIVSHCVSSNKHCWVSVDKYYIDLTCSQYDGLGDFLVLEKKEFMRKVKNNDASYCYVNSEKVKENDYKYAFTSWGGGQAPTNDVMKDILSIGESNV